MNTSVITKRYRELDSLRGLAALSVFISHVVGATENTGKLFRLFDSSVLRILWDGSAAVMLFFILSGFVLSLPYLNNESDNMNIFSFLIKRVFRIYPAYIVAILFSLCLKIFLFNPETMVTLSDWIRDYWTTDTSLIVIVQHLIMLGFTYDTQQIDPVIWSLLLEMKASIILPFILILFRATKSLTSMLLVLVLCVASSLAFNNFLLLTLSLFISGLILSKYRSVIISKIGKAPLLAKILLAVVGILLYSFKSESIGEYVQNYIVSIGACIIIVLSLTIPKASRILTILPIEFLGKISYSFYLLHLPILFTCLSLSLRYTKILLIPYILSFILSLVLSFVVYRAIEVPFIQLGRKFVSISDRFKTKISQKYFYRIRSIK